MKKLFLVLASLFIFSVEIFAQQRADALVLYKNGRYAEAIEICEQEIKEDPSNVDSYCVLCWSLVRNKQYAEGEQRATEARKISPNDVRIIEIQAEAKYYLGKNNGALELFQLYLSTAPSNASRIENAYYYCGEIYVRQAKYQHADMAFTAAVRIYPTSELWWTRCGYAREMAGSYDSALEAYNKALELSPSREDALNGKNRILAKKTR